VKSCPVTGVTYTAMNGISGAALPTPAPTGGSAKVYDLRARRVFDVRSRGVRTRRGRFEPRVILRSQPALRLVPQFDVSLKSHGSVPPGVMLVVVSDVRWAGPRPGRSSATGRGFPNIYPQL
jgi:hypothetical protein